MFFIYENNKSMSSNIKQNISNTFGFEPICINSKLVSAQNRQRLYWVGKRNNDNTYAKVDIEQPQDKQIFLSDILNNGCDLTSNQKSFALTARYGCAVAWNTLERKQRNMVLEPVNCTSDGKAQTINNICKYTSTFGATGVAESVNKSYAISVQIKNGIPTQAVSQTDNKTYTVYKVENNSIFIKDKMHPIKAIDGYYIIRKLTVSECKKLQTVPEQYEFPVSDSQAYKLLGNGWTIDVIAHLIRSAINTL